MRARHTLQPVRRMRKVLRQEVHVSRHQACRHWRIVARASRDPARQRCRHFAGPLPCSASTWTTSASMNATSFTPPCAPRHAESADAIGEYQPGVVIVNCMDSRADECIDHIYGFICDRGRAREGVHLVRGLTLQRLRCLVLARTHPWLACGLQRWQAQEATLHIMCVDDQRIRLRQRGVNWETFCSSVGSSWKNLRFDGGSAMLLTDILSPLERQTYEHGTQNIMQRGHSFKSSVDLGCLRDDVSYCPGPIFTNVGVIGRCSVVHRKAHIA